MKTLLLFSVLSLSLSGQTKISLTQLPGCAITSTTPTNMPIVLALVPTSTGLTQFACYTFSGASVTPATPTSPATITLSPSVLLSFIDGEIPSGLIDGKNATFNLAFPPLTGSLLLFRNGLLQQLNVDYTLALGSIAFLSASVPQQGDTLQASYRH
jgi:hypothetical protein